MGLFSVSTRFDVGIKPVPRSRSKSRRGVKGRSLVPMTRRLIPFMTPLQIAEISKCAQVLEVLNKSEDSRGFVGPGMRRKAGGGLRLVRVAISWCLLSVVVPLAFHV